MNSARAGFRMRQITFSKPAALALGGVAPLVSAAALPDRD